MSEVMQDQQHPEDTEEDAKDSFSSSSTDHEKSGFWGSCMTTFREEFHVRNFGFNFPNHDAFKTSQWRWPPYVFICFRLFLAIYSIAVLIWTIVDSSNYEYPWPTWLTNWAFLILTLHLVYSAISVLVDSGRGSRREKISGYVNPYGTMTDEESLGQTTKKTEPELPFYLKLDWFLFVLSSSSAPIVTTVYWIFLAPTKGVPFSGNKSIPEHLTNSVLVALELAISATPVRLYHFIYVMLFAFVYVIFTVIYWAIDHNNILYKSFTNWNEPTGSIIRLVIVLFVAIPVLQFFLFCVYQIRLAIYRCIYHESYTHRPPQHSP